MAMAHTLESCSFKKSASAEESQVVGCIASGAKMVKQTVGLFHKHRKGVVFAKKQWKYFC